jgi:opine dehydrogenase
LQPQHPAEAHIFRRKNTLPLAALPATRTQAVLDVVQEIYPQFIAAKNVLYTSLNNMGAIFHPALTLLNAGWIEATSGDFEFYIEGVTPTIGRILERLDRERVTVATALGIRAQTAQEWLARAYSAHGETLQEAIHANPGYRGITAPRILRHRYIFEDVPYSLVPMAELGRRFGVDVVGMEALTQLPSCWHRLPSPGAPLNGWDWRAISRDYRLAETGEVEPAGL